MPTADSALRYLLLLVAAASLSASAGLSQDADLDAELARAKAEIEVLSQQRQELEQQLYLRMRHLPSQPGMEDLERRLAVLAKQSDLEVDVGELQRGERLRYASGAPSEVVQHHVPVTARGTLHGVWYWLRRQSFFRADWIDSAILQVDAQGNVEITIDLGIATYEPADDTGSSLQDLPPDASRTPGPFGELVDMERRHLLRVQAKLDLIDSLLLRVGPADVARLVLTLGEALRSAPAALASLRVDEGVVEVSLVRGREQGPEDLGAGLLERGLRGVSVRVEPLASGQAAGSSSCRRIVVRVPTSPNPVRQAIEDDDLVADGERWTAEPLEDPSGRQCLGLAD